MGRRFRPETMVIGAVRVRVVKDPRPGDGRAYWRGSVYRDGMDLCAWAGWALAEEVEGKVRAACPKWAGEDSTAAEKRRAHRERFRGSVVYFVQAGAGGPIKIGTSRSGANRMKALQQAAPQPLVLLATIPGDTKVEQAFHVALAHAHIHGEWFEPTPGVVAVIEELADRSENRRSQLPLREL